MSVLLRVTDERRGDVVVSAVEGEVDASNVAELGAGLRAALDNRSVALIVDLTGTTYLDSAGINLLFALGAELGERQQQLHLVVPGSAPIARAIAITGLDAAVPTHGTRATALERLER